MTNHPTEEHPTEERLNDYVDGLLPGPERGRLERHLSACARCRVEEERLRATVDGLAALPRSIPPERDLAPEIRRRIGASGRRLPAEDAAGRRGTLRTLWSHRLPLAAAAVLLVAGSSLLTVALMESRERAGRAPAGAGLATEVTASGNLAPAAGRLDVAALPSAATLADYRAVEDQYAAAAEALEAVLERRRSALTPETVRLIEENLRIIDRAIAESRAALAADPGNVALRELIVATYERKLDLLRRAAEFAIEG